MKANEILERELLCSNKILGMFLRAQHYIQVCGGSFRARFLRPLHLNL